jgi:hypothetical protein
VAFECDLEPVPRRLASEDEIVQPAEQPQRQVPLEIGCDAGDPRVAGELTTDAGVQR